MASSNSSLEARTARTLQRLGLQPADSALVAVSGGVDSMSMLHVLAALREGGHIHALFAIHVNHSLRGDASEADERLVQKECDRLRVSLEVHRVDTAAFAREQKVGIEEAARDLRYRSFVEALEKTDARFVITAHTANDQAETVLMNIVRGAGLRGLSGIPERRPLGNATLLRPWLSVTREDVELYAADASVRYSEDASNAELVFRRNRVRLKVLPALAEAYPDRDVVGSIGRLAERMSRVADFVASLARRELQAVRRPNGLDLDGLRALPPEIAVEAIELWLNDELGRYRLSTEQRERLGRFLEHDSGRLELTSISLESTDGRLVIAEAAASFEPVILTELREVTLPQGRLRLQGTSEAVLDADHLYVAESDLASLRIRPWQDGDRMEPFGMAGQSKLVSDLLTDARVTAKRRHSYPVLESDREIIWVPGVRAAESTRVGTAVRGAVGAQRGVLLEWLPTDEE